MRLNAAITAAALVAGPAAADGQGVEGVRVVDLGHGMYEAIGVAVGTGGDRTVAVPASNTFMVGEDVPRFNTHCDWVFFNHATGTTAIPLNSAMQAGQPGFNSPGDWPNVYSFRSRHTQGANFLLGDGGVRFVRQSIDLNTYRALATRAGGDVGGPLQRGGARRAAGRHRGGVVGAQVAELVLDADDRLLGKRHARRRRGRGLRLDRQVIR